MAQQIGIIDQHGQVHQAAVGLETLAEAKAGGFKHVPAMLNARFPTRKDQPTASQQLYAQMGAGQKNLKMNYALQGQGFTAGAVTEDGSIAGRLVALPYLMDTLENKLTASDYGIQALFNRKAAVIDSINGTKFDRPFLNFSKPEGARSRAISQLSEPASMLTLTTSDKSWKIAGSSIGMEISDEAAAATSLDIVSLSMTRQAEVEALERIEQQLLAFLNGDTDLDMLAELPGTPGWDWDGKVLRFRSGNEVKAPRWFIDGLPSQPLDGELWLGRGRFERLSGIVRREVPEDAEWRQVRYMIFELPGAPGTFRERAAAMRQLVQQQNVSWLREIEQFSVVDREDLLKKFKAIVKAGGEGLMLHKADAFYETGRGDTLLKMKPADDAEAVVIGHLPGKGKHAGVLGALRVRTPDGREFSLGGGFTDEQRRNPPAVGATVTYRYHDLTRHGLPRFASFLRLRNEP